MVCKNNQEMLLNKILENRDFSIITRWNINEEFFPFFKSEFNFIKNHINKFGTVPDKITFVNTFPDFTIVEVNEPDAYLIDELIKDRNKNMVMAELKAISTQINDTQFEDYDKILASIKHFAENISISKGVSSTDITKDLSRFDRYVSKCESSLPAYIPTGFPELDAITGGLDIENDYGVIIARTGVGKSWITLKMAAAASLAGFNVGIYSGEMTVDKVAYRLDTLIGHVNNGAITHFNPKYKAEYASYIGTLDTYGLGPINVMTPLDVNGHPTVDSLRAFIQKEQLDVLYIDQMSLLEDARNGRTEREQLSNISKDLKNLQVSCKIPIVLVCQQNRPKANGGQSQKEDDDISSVDIFGSDRIGQDCTFLIGVSKKYEPPKPGTTKSKTIFTLTLAKVRDGGDGQNLTYLVDLNRGMFEYLPDGAQMTSDDAEELKDYYGDENVITDPLF